MNRYEIAEALRGRREQNARDRQRRLDALRTRRPDFEALLCERNALLARAALQKLSGNAKEAQESTKKAQALDAREREILAEEHLPPDWLEIHYDCPDCQDIGFTPDGGICTCLKQKIREANFTEYDLSARASECTFKNADMTVFSDEKTEQGYSARVRALLNYRIARDYCTHFSPKSRSLFLTGQTGTGKTYLTSCIVNALLEKDVDLIYISAPNLIQMYHEDMNAHTPIAQSNRKTFTNCRLLIIDDLGTESDTGFSRSAIGALIDERLVQGRQSIITTNLKLRDLPARYSERVMSRISGAYDILPFTGEDLRLSNRTV